MWCTLHSNRALCMVSSGGAQRGARFLMAIAVSLAIRIYYIRIIYTVSTLQRCIFTVYLPLYLYLEVSLVSMVLNIYFLVLVTNFAFINL